MDHKITAIIFYCFRLRSLANKVTSNPGNSSLRKDNSLSLIKDQVLWGVLKTHQDLDINAPELIGSLKEKTRYSRGRSKIYISKDELNKML